MEHHLHLILSSEEASKEVGDFKSFTAKMMLRSLKENGHDHILRWLEIFRRRHKDKQTYQVWQEGSHPQLVHNEEMLFQKLDYIHYNPVRAGYVDEPEHWRYSSVRFYAGQDCLLPISVVR